MESLTSRGAPALGLCAIGVVVACSGVPPTSLAARSSGDGVAPASAAAASPAVASTIAAPSTTSSGSGAVSVSPRAPAKPRPFRPLRPSRPLNTFPTRATTETATPVDIDAIPLATAVDIGTDASKFTLRRLDSTPKNCPPKTWPPKRITYSLELHSIWPMLMQVGSVTLPDRSFLDGLHDTPALDRIPRSGQVPATWASVLRANGGDAVDVTELDGTYDVATSQGLADSKVRVRAPMLGTDTSIYAYRRCSEHCDGAAADRTEELTLIGPPAVWVGSTEESTNHSVDQRASFTRLTVPIHAGSATTLEIIAFDDDVVRFRKGRLPMIFGEVGKENQWTTFSLEIVWPEETTSPSLTAFVSHGSGDTSAIRNDLTSLFVVPGFAFVSGCIGRDVFGSIQ